MLLFSDVFSLHAAVSKDGDHALGSDASHAFAEVYRAIGNDLQAVLTALPADVLARTIRT
jgi:hypothetical protein